MQKTGKNLKGIFGKRLAKLRKEAGYSQRSFAKKIGISNRMVAYYEAQTDRAPVHLMSKITKILKISADELLGIKPLKK